MLLFIGGEYMFPGGRMSPRQMQRAMRQMGINMEELKDVEEVIIKTSRERYIFVKPSVMCIRAQGQESFQIVGKYIKEELKAYAEEDIKLVMEQAGVDRETAIKALEECDGKPADAILKLMEGEEH